MPNRTRKKVVPAPESPEAIVFPEGVPVRVGRYHGHGGPRPYAYAHAEMEFQLIRQGTGRYFIGGQVHHYRRNSVLVISRHEVHYALPHPESKVERDNLLLQSTLVRDNPRIHAVLGAFQGVHHVLLSEKTAVACRYLLETIAAECHARQPFWKEMTLVDVERFILAIARAARSQPRSSGPGHPLMSRILQYIDRHYAEPLSLAGVAGTFNLSPYTLSRVFKKTNGVGFKQYVTHKRIVAARKLLEKDQYKIAAIAFEVGFNDLSAFNREFKLWVGLNPSDYRRLVR